MRLLAIVASGCVMQVSCAPGSGSPNPSAAGRLDATGGTASATGGTASATGGIASATGGTASATGGTASATGGDPEAGGAARIPTGGTSGSSGGTGGAATGGSGGTETGGATTSGGDCPASQNLAAGDHDFTIQSANGLTYTYTVVVPSTVVAGKRAPLTVFWHALDSDPEESRGLTSIDAKTAALGMITVHPRSPDKSWDVGSCCTTIVNGTRRDETIFAKELVADVESKLCIDPKRVYTTGFSNGGMISQMLACKMSDVFAAAAPIGSTLTIPVSDCHPSRPIPIFMIAGTADPLVGYGAPGLAGGISVSPDDLKTWASLDQCTGDPKITVQNGKATCNTYTQCAGGGEVTLCSVNGMGHCIPGMKEESPTNCYTKVIPLGMPNHDIDGIDLTTQFLAKHTLP